MYVLSRSRKQLICAWVDFRMGESGPRRRFRPAGESRMVYIGAATVALAAVAVASVFTARPQSQELQPA